MKNILVIGTGSIGERHVRCFLATGRAAISICEPNAQLRARIEKEYGLNRSFPDIEEALDLNWDAAVIATPAHTHIPIAQRCADRGIHLFIEKPLSTGFTGVSALQKTVREKNLVAAVAYVYRAHPGVEWLKQIVEDGRFGGLRQLTVLSGQHFPFYRPAYREIYYAHKEKGGGTILDCLTHFLNLAEFLAGPFSTIIGDASHQVLEGVEVEDTVHVIARQDQVMTSFALNQYQAPNESLVTLVFEKGAARFDIPQNRCRWMTEPGGDWIDIDLPELDRDGWFIRQAEAFLDSLEGKRPVLCTLEEGIRSLKATLALG